MRRSEFHRAVSDEFGGRANAVVTDLYLAKVGGRTAAQAIDAGVDPGTASDDSSHAAADRLPRPAHNGAASRRVVEYLFEVRVGSCTAGVESVFSTYSEGAKTDVGAPP